MKRRIKSGLCILLSLIFMSMSLIPVAYAFGDDPMSGKVDEISGLQKTKPDETIEYTHDSRFSVGYTVADVIDVSRFNGTIDWSAVASSGIKYAVIRVGYRGYGSEGTINLDANFKTNIVGAINAGINVGVYFYTQATSQSEAREEADFVLENIIGYDLRLPVAFDCEYASDSNGYTGRFYEANLSKTDTALMCKAFCDRVSAAGYDAMVYANPYMFTNHIDASQIGGYPIWLAHYNPTADYSGDYVMWQYSSKQTVSGITGNVDKSFYYIKDGITPSYLRLHASKLSVTQGDTAKVSAFFDTSTFTSVGCTVGNIEFTSSATDIATINSDGTVNCVAVGSATITASVTVTFPDINNTGTPQTSTVTKSVNISVTEKPIDNTGSNLLTTILNALKAIINVILKLLSSLAG